MPQLCSFDFPTTPGLLLMQEARKNASSSSSSSGSSSSGKKKKKLPAQRFACWRRRFLARQEQWDAAFLSLQLAITASMRKKKDKKKKKKAAQPACRVYLIQHLRAKTMLSMLEDKKKKKKKDKKAPDPDHVQGCLSACTAHARRRG